MSDIRAPDYELAERDYMLGMKYKDIAEKYNVSINTVKSWKQRYNWNRKGMHTNKKGMHTKKSNETKNNKPIADEVKSVLENEELTDKQRLFCLYYVKCFNATKAYQKAYEVDYNTAASIAYRLLENDGVKNEIKRLKQNKLNKAFLEPEDIFQKYMDIAFADITDYVSFGQEDVIVSFDDKGNPITRKMNVINLGESTEVDGTILSEVSQGKDGIKVKLLDKMKALQWLSDHMDMATEEQRLKCEKLRAEIDKVKEDKENTESRVVIVDDIEGEEYGGN